jgi:hypothetical protein
MTSMHPKIFPVNANAASLKAYNHPCNRGSSSSKLYCGAGNQQSTHNADPADAMAFELNFLREKKDAAQERRVQSEDRSRLPLEKPPNCTSTTPYPNRDVVSSGDLFVRGEDLLDFALWEKTRIEGPPDEFVVRRDVFEGLLHPLRLG